MLLPKAVTTNSWLLLLFLPIASAINPSGNCTDTTGNNGARPGYHSPGSSVYLPDCKNPLNQELWRVFEQADGTSYIIPRPDGLGDAYGLCVGKWQAKAEQYGLCDANITRATVALMNSMDPADALLFTNVFHRQLRFEVDALGAIVPFAPDEDLLAACDLLPQNSTLQMQAQDYCSALAKPSEIELAIIPSPEASHALVPALNAYYGVPQVGENCSVAEWGTPIHGCPVADCAPPVAAGCEMARGHYGINQFGDCCEKQCHFIDPISGLECYEVPPQSCNPIVEGINATMNCETKNCTSPAREGCSFKLGEYVMDEEGNCCEKQCHQVDEYGNECLDKDDSSPFREDESEEVQCRQDGTETCGVVRCAAPPTGCTYKFDHYILTEMGVCCAAPCYAVDSNGNKCSENGPMTESITASEAVPVGARCTNQESGCPVARCANPPQGCTFKFDHFIVLENGKCCPALCYSVDSSGTGCSSEYSQTVASAEEKPAREADGEEEVLCEPTGREFSCPVATCTPAPEGCQYKMDHYVLNLMGTCCPAQCYAVGSNGNECMPDNPPSIVGDSNVAELTTTDTELTSGGELNNADSFTTLGLEDSSSSGGGKDESDIEVATVTDVEEKPNATTTVTEGECTPNGDEACPVARCTAPPEGCTHKDDHYVLTSTGVCCPAMCYAVDSEGAECVANENTEEGHLEETGEHMEHTEEEQQQKGAVGDSCVPVEPSTTTSMARQASPPSCPVARCTTPPPGCSYVDGPFVIKGSGNCCPEQCYAVDSNGNHCTEEGSVGEEAEASSGEEVEASGANMAKQYWLLPSLVAVAIFFFGN